MGTEEQWAQRNSGHRGTVGTEEQWAQRNIGHSGTVGTEEQWARVLCFVSFCFVLFFIFLFIFHFIMPNSLVLFNTAKNTNFHVSAEF